MASKRPRTNTRRAPQQERSQVTVDAILSAARELVERDGARGMTTNAVARRAGVSIGTLYQYFASKQAILTELRERHQRAGEQVFGTELSALIDKPVAVATRRFVERFVEFHRAEPGLHQALENHPRDGLLSPAERAGVAMLLVYLEHHRDELVVTDLDQASLVVMITAESITHAVAAERPALLADDTLIEGVVRMLLAYLVGDPSGVRPAAAATIADQG